MKSFKYIYLIMLVSMIALLPCITMAVAFSFSELVTDNSFELGNLATDWTPTNASASMTEAETGSWSAKITAANGLIVQTITNPNNQNYYCAVGFWAKNDDVSNTATLTATIVDNGATQNYVVTLGPSSAWTKFTFYHTIQVASGNTFTLQFKSSIASVYFDEIEMTSHPSNGSFETDVQGSTSGGGPSTKDLVPNDFFPDTWDRVWETWHATFRATDPMMYYQAISIGTVDAAAGGSANVDGNRCGLLSFIGFVPGTSGPFNEWVSFYQTVGNVRNSFATPADKTATVTATLWSQYGACSAIMRVGNSWNSFADTTTIVTTTPTAYSSPGLSVTSANASDGAWVQIICITPRKPMYVDAVKLKVQ